MPSNKSNNHWRNKGLPRTLSVYIRMHLHTMHLVPTGQTQVTKYLFASPENQTLPEAPRLWIYHAHKAQIPKLCIFLS